MCDIADNDKKWIKIIKCLSWFSNLNFQTVENSNTHHHNSQETDNDRDNKWSRERERESAWRRSSYVRWGKNPNGFVKNKEEHEKKQMKKLHEGKGTHARTNQTKLLSHWKWVCFESFKAWPSFYLVTFFSIFFSNWHVAYVWIEVSPNWINKNHLN